MPYSTFTDLVDVQRPRPNVWYIRFSAKQIPSNKNLTFEVKILGKSPTKEEIAAAIQKRLEASEIPNERKRLDIQAKRQNIFDRINPIVKPSPGVPVEIEPVTAVPAPVREQGFLTKVYNSIRSFLGL